MTWTIIIGLSLWAITLLWAMRAGQAAAKPWPDYTEQHDHEGQGECPQCL